MAMTALATRADRQQSAIEAQSAYIEERRDLIREKIAYQEVTDPEFELFIEVCKLRMLNPLANQINCIKRAGKASYEPTIDGFRLVASRTGEFAGADPYVFGYDEQGQLDSATCTIYRMVEGQRCAFSYTVYWEERCPRDRDGNLRPINNWVTMPRNMLGKCAETAVLRQAFPEECGGLYAAEEMEQADSPARAPQPMRAKLAPVAAPPVHEEEPPADDAPPARARPAPPAKAASTALTVTALEDGLVIPIAAVSRQHGITKLAQVNTYLTEHGFAGGGKQQIADELENTYSVRISGNIADAYPSALYDIACALITGDEEEYGG